MATPIALYINGYDVGDDMEWGISTEEVLGGTGRATLLVQDRTNSWVPEAHWDVKAVIRATGWVLYRGEIISTPLELTLGMDWRIWQMQCADYNNEFPQRLVGAMDGKTWMDTSGLGVFVNIDPYGTTLDTDKLTVQALLDHYIRVNGEAFETSTYVEEYVTELFPRSWYYKQLQDVLEELAAIIVANLQFWADPDLFFHWVTIPAWQDLAQEVVAVALDDAQATSGLMAPEGVLSGLAFAPYEVVDIDADPDSGKIGFHSLKVTFDGKDMAEQIYVRGSTGYVYNAPPLGTGSETKTTVKAPTAGAADRYELTFLDDTKLWHTDGTGYVSVSYDRSDAGAHPGPYKVKWVRIAWNEARNKGGNFWKLLEGPYQGKLVDDNTNVLWDYGEIRVQKVVTAPGDPVIGIGGSGWVNEVDQDPNKRQAFLDLPISSDQATRNSMGGMALYRGSFETLRGSFVSTGYDGWRAGQLVHITDSRLPAQLNGKWFIIQRVRTELHPGTDLRKYTIDWGDGPTSRWSGEKQPGPVDWPNPATMIEISVHDLSPGPNSSQRITGQLINASGEPWAIEGKTVNWSLECYNNLGVLQPGQGSVKPTVSITDRHGKAYTTFKSGAGVDLVYYIFADVKAT
jgi:hypothetical protein